MPAEELVELIDRRFRRERLNLLRTMRHEQHLLNKVWGSEKTI